VVSGLIALYMLVALLVAWLRRDRELREKLKQYFPDVGSDLMKGE
jgi:hypothetical protein